MMRSGSAVTVFFLLLLLFGCNKNKYATDEQRQEKKPLGLSLERIIEGEIAGARLSEPFDIAADDLQNLYLVDAGNNRLLKFDRELEFSSESGGFGFSDGLLNGPSYITIGNNLNLYISDVGNQRIAVFNTGLKFMENIDLIDSEDTLIFGRPAGLAVNQFGELLMVDQDNSHIAVFESYSIFTHFLGEEDSYSNLLLTPQAIAIDPEGEILVSDIGNSRLAKFDSYGTYLGGPGRDYLETPSDIDFDRFGNIWVVDAALPAIVCLDEDGQLLFSIGTSGRDGPYSFNHPSGLVVLPTDLLVLCDTGNDRLLVYKIHYSE